MRLCLPLVLLLVCFSALALQTPEIRMVGLELDQYAQISGIKEPDQRRAAELRLWDGEDLLELSASFGSLAESSQYGAFAEAAAGRFKGQKVQVLGCFDTGTNLLTTLLRQNFGQNIILQPTTVPTTMPTSSRKPYLWKHMSLRRYFEHEPSARQEFSSAGIVALAMIRDPLSWLQSVRKAPYNLDACVKQENWLARPCNMHFEMWGGKQVIQFDDIETYWNQNTKDYHDLAGFGFNRSMVIRYEDLVLHTESVMDSLADLLGLEHPSVLTQVNKPAKMHGASLGRQEAIEKLQKKSYLQQYEGAEREEACRRLDTALLSKHGYTDCPKQTETG